MVRFFILGLFILTAGCAYFLPPDLQHVTKDRCEALDMKALGKKDAVEGYSRGSKFEWWSEDCKQKSVALNRDLYDQGYNTGLLEYCSCETAFVAGVKEEILEIRKLYFECKEDQRKIMGWAHEKGELQKDDESLMKKTTTLKVDYFDDKILSRAQELCARRVAQ